MAAQDGSGGPRLRHAHAKTCRIGEHVRQDAPAHEPAVCRTVADDQQPLAALVGDPGPGGAADPGVRRGGGPFGRAWQPGLHRRLPEPASGHPAGPAAGDHRVLGSVRLRPVPLWRDRAVHRHELVRRAAQHDDGADPDIGPFTNISVKNIYSRSLDSDSYRYCNDTDRSDRVFTDVSVNVTEFIPGVCATSGPNIGQCTPGDVVPSRDPSGLARSPTKSISASPWRTDVRSSRATIIPSPRPASATTHSSASPRSGSSSIPWGAGALRPVTPSDRALAVTEITREHFTHPAVTPMLNGLVRTMKHGRAGLTRCGCGRTSAWATPTPGRAG